MEIMKKKNIFRSENKYFISKAKERDWVDSYDVLFRAVVTAVLPPLRGCGPH